MIQMDLRDDIIERAWNSGKEKYDTIENRELDEPPEYGIEFTR